jgi:hypothetical protein
MGVCTHCPVPVSQLSAVQGLPSSHPPVHDPHDPLGTCSQPSNWSQESCVQELPSSQLSGVPGWQTPPEQVSFPLQTLLSLHDVPSGTAACWQPAAGSHESTVQGLPSSQLSAGVTVWQLPSVPQASTPLQTLLSLHVSAAGLHIHVYWCSQPATGSQLSAVHPLLSSQLSGLPGWQLPFEQVS